VDYGIYHTRDDVGDDEVDRGEGNEATVDLHIVCGDGASGGDDSCGGPQRQDQGDSRDGSRQQADSRHWGDTRAVSNVDGDSDGDSNGDGASNGFSEHASLLGLWPNRQPTDPDHGNTTVKPL
jgi:hypothetical protein